MANMPEGSIVSEAFVWAQIMGHRYFCTVILFLNYNLLNFVYWRIPLHLSGALFKVEVAIIKFVLELVLFLVGGSYNFYCFFYCQLLTIAIFIIINNATTHLVPFIIYFVIDVSIHIL